MNTNYILTKEQFNAFTSVWKKLTNDKELRTTLKPYHYALHAILLGKDPSEGFSPVINPRKLANGAYANHAFYNAIDTLKYAAKGNHGYWSKVCIERTIAPFEGIVTAEMLSTILPILPEVSLI